MKAEPTLLLRDGRFIAAAIRAQRLTRDEVPSALHAEGRANVDGVGALVLETDGSMGVLDARPGRGAEPTLVATR